MTSTTPDLDALKVAVASTTTCTTATVVALKELLLADDSKASSKTTATNVAKTPSRARSKAAAAPLGKKERVALATHVINVTFKSLTEAAKPTTSVSATSPASRPTTQDGSEARTPGQKRTLRRSNSQPLTPIQPRTLNRVATSPIVTTKAAAKSATQTNATRCATTAECARIAFSALRAAKGGVKAEDTDFQLENGIVVFVGKLTTLGMHDYAIKELRLLQKRLDVHAPAEPAKTTTSEKASTTVGDLVQFHGTVSTASLPIITAYQLQLLKWVAATKKAGYVEEVVAYLGEDYANSPVNLLQRMADEQDEDVRAKTARSLSSFSQVLLSMCPSVSSSEDAVATESRLSPSPLTSFQIQAIAFQAQLRWWKIAGHIGNVDGEILPSFSRCARALTRRDSHTGSKLYEALKASVQTLLAMITARGLSFTTSAKSPIATIYNILGSTAQTARMYDDAYQWFDKLEQMSGTEISSVAQCSLSARLLSVALKRGTVEDSASDLLQKVTNGLEGSLSGTSTELNDLFESVSVCRRSIVGLLVANWKSSETESTLSPTLKTRLETFVLKYPRFIRRWLGTQPAKDAPAKQMLQFDQRRQMLTPLMSQILDASCVVAKAEMDKANPETWASIDEVLQDILEIIDTLHDPVSRSDHLAPYTVKISSIYFSKHLTMRKEKEKSKEANKMLLQTLNRSIEAVNDRSPAEKEKAQLSTKLELLAELCKRSGRSEDAVANLRSICTNMVEEGILSRVTTLLATQPPALAWAADDKAAALSRALRSIAKLDKSWNDWTFFLPELERAAVVEHLLHIVHSSSVTGEPLRLYDPAMAALLRLYAIERFPVRRLRTLLLLYSQSLDDDRELGRIQEHLAATLEKLQNKDLGEDAGLAGHIEHLKAYHVSLTAMLDLSTFPGQDFRAAVESWKTIVRRCQTKADLYAAIDNPDNLLEHLKSLGELSDLKGETQLQVAFSDLIISISKIWEGSVSNRLVAHQSKLASQYLNIGLYAQAAVTLKETEELIAQSSDVSPKAKADFHLAQAEYLAGIGQSDEARVHISKADDISTGSSTKVDLKTQQALVSPLSHYIQSLVALQLGDVAEALGSIKTGLRYLTHEWTKIEDGVKPSADQSDTSLLNTSMRTLSISDTKTDFTGPRVWAVAPSFLRSLLQISTVYAHIGLFQETCYYAEYADKIAAGTGSTLFQAQVATWTGTVYAKASKLDKASEKLFKAKDFLPEDTCAARVKLANELAGFYRDLGKEEESAKYFQIAVETAEKLRVLQVVEPTKAPEAKKPVAKRAAPATTARATRATRTTTRAAPAAVALSTRTRAAPTRRGVAATKPEEEATPAFQDTNDVYRSSLVASVALARALTFIQQQDWESALNVLGTIREMPKLNGTMSQEQIITATSLIGQGMELMVEDPVFSVMQDSTLSFPATSAAFSKMAVGSPEKSPQPKTRTTAATKKGAAHGSNVPLFAHALVKAHELLMDAHSSGLAVADSAAVHRISALLQSTVMMLSASPITKGMTATSPVLATVAAELARNIAWKREQMTLKPSSAPSKKTQNRARRSSMGLVSDISRLQTNYIELVPHNWSVISMSLSENRHDLYITKFQAGHSPFVLRLPLERANSRDIDAGIFNFEHGHAELLDIIHQANETCHSSKDFTVKEERTAWWAEREALDERLKELLLTIETTWLGGFRGIFSQHQRRADLLARFQKSFNKILDGCLPSRNQRMGRGKKTAGKSTPVALDSRILELFIGLGDPNEPTSDFDEALNDLLYFVVDILQFHGERNAYDEIDFDAMVVETYDALRGYHAAMRGAHGREADAHTILVLDKALHTFPWESLPCMENLAVSRVPSLSCLRRLLTEASRPEDKPAGHYVSPGKGTYILNPSSDLKNTQKYFQPAFDKHLTTWTSHVNVAPEEQTMEAALSGDSDIFLYFGHGSGAQYIRSSRIRSLPKSYPVTFLMGCSSASLTSAGEFEVYGPVWNYLMAGAPAVVGTLWDVTDRDIDRYAGRVFEEWGLFEPGVFKDDKESERQKAVRKAGGRAEGVSLCEAVGKSRGVCRFRYLNAAAVVQYGIPAYIKRED